MSLRDPPPPRHLQTEARRIIVGMASRQPECDEVDMKAEALKARKELEEKGFDRIGNRLGDAASPPLCRATPRAAARLGSDERLPLSQRKRA